MAMLIRPSGASTRIYRVLATLMTILDGNAPAVLCPYEQLAACAVDGISVSCASVLQFVLQRTRIVERAIDHSILHSILVAQ